MRVDNPLTLISIFSAAAEGFAVYALVNLPLETQKVFIYFVMLFPILLVSLFFFALLFKNQCLYAPSDFTDQEHYLIANNLKNNLLHKLDERIEREIKTNKDGEKYLRKIKEDIESTINESPNTLAEANLLNFLRSHKGEFYTLQALGHIAMISKRRALATLQNLEAKGLILRGVDSKDNTTLWGINKEA